MLSRRDLIRYIGMAGGSTALYQVAMAMGIAPGAMAADALDLTPTTDGKKVVILGAGIAGLVAAYELKKAGYQVEVLEASHRVGGRSLTLRHGDVVDEIGNRQICQFDEDPDLYFNAGPTRIPTQHTRILNYCKELGVELQPFLNVNPSAWIQYDTMFGGERMRQREYAADARGFLAELLTKSITEEWLNQPVSALDKERLLEFVSRYGDLDAQGLYKGSSRAGFANDGLLDAGIVQEAREFSELLKADYWKTGMHFGESESQSAVLQPVGGMDKIVHALQIKVAESIKIGAQVVGIQTSNDEVKVSYRHQGKTETAIGAYCLNSIPGQLLAGIPNNFSLEFNQALVSRPRGKIGKIAFQMKERFWEKEGIYGGISWTGQDIGQIMYPPHSFHKQKGVLVGGYFLPPGITDRFTAMTADERIEASIQQGEKLHPGYRSYVENGVSVAWYRMNHMLGCTARELDKPTQDLLRKPEGRHYLMGDQVASHSGWQESAVLTAHAALNEIQKRENAQVRS